MIEIPQINDENLILRRNHKPFPRRRRSLMAQVRPGASLSLLDALTLRASLTMVVYAMAIIDALPQFELLQPDVLVRQAKRFRLPESGVELLVAIDRVLRSLSAGGLLEKRAESGWVLSGPTALHGVYLRSTVLLRVPDELTLAPLSEQPNLSAQKLAALIASALPNGQIESHPDSPECYLINYRGVLGPARLPLRLERTPLRMEPPLEAKSASIAERGYLFDERLPYLPRIAQSAIPVPVAYVEELLLRTIIAILSPKRDDTAARVDDLRLAVLIEYSDSRRAMAGPIRDALLTGMIAKDVTSAKDLRLSLSALVTKFRQIVESYDVASALPAHLRPTDEIYDSTSRMFFERRLDELCSDLMRGRQ